MPIHEIRETIQLSGSTTNGVLQMQKRIEIQAGKRHTINHIDFFDDGLVGATNTGGDFGYQVYLSNYPIVLTQNQFHQSGMVSGPLAGDDLVLFKANALSYDNSAGTPLPQYVRQEFPNAFLSSAPTFNFYTPQLYFTVVFTDVTNDTFSKNVAMSLYMAVESKNCDAVEYGIGMLREYNSNQAMVLRNQGIVIDQAEIIAAMPMWQIGGIRPEIMSANDINTLGQQWYYSEAGYGEGETMSSSTQVRAGLSAARTMSSFGKAFGSVADEIPDWFKSIAKPFPGLESGPVRAQFPPLKFNDNGNTLMF